LTDYTIRFAEQIRCALLRERSMILREILMRSIDQSPPTAPRYRAARREAMSALFASGEKSDSARDRVVAQRTVDAAARSKPRR